MSRDHFSVFEIIDFDFIHFLMELKCLFSRLEFYVTDKASILKSEENGKSLCSLIRQEQGIIHSFINDFVTLIISTREDYSKVVESPLYRSDLPVVSPNWVFECISSRCLFPYVSLFPSLFDVGLL